MARPFFTQRGAFAEVVRERGKAHVQRVILTRRVIDHHHHMHAGIDFRVMRGSLRHAV